MTADSSFYRTKYDSNVIPKIIERLCFFLPREHQLCLIPVRFLCVIHGTIIKSTIQILFLKCWNSFGGLKKPAKISVSLYSSMKIIKPPIFSGMQQFFFSNLRK